MKNYTYKELKIVVRRCNSRAELAQLALILLKFKELFTQKVIDNTYEAIRVRRIFLKR